MTIKLCTGLIKVVSIFSIIYKDNENTVDNYFEVVLVQFKLIMTHNNGEICIEMY